MLNNFLPSSYVKSVFEINPNELLKMGIKGIITDLDNTLVAWDRKDATPEIIKWFDDMKSHGLKVIIISNNNEERVKFFSEPLGVPFLPKARKPLRRTFKQGLNVMGLKKEEVVVVGDQLLTDVLGGNRAGFYTILVVPVVETDALITKFNRRIERTILNYFRKKGKINWEE